jgi:hypothetical protein
MYAYLFKKTKRCYGWFKHTMNEPSSDYAQRWGGNYGNVQNILNTTVLEESPLQNQFPYFLRLSNSSLTEHKNVLSLFRNFNQI